MQISALKSHIDEQKHRCSTPQKSHPFAEKIEDLQEKLEKQIENNKKLISDVSFFFCQKFLLLYRILFICLYLFINSQYLHNIIKTINKLKVDAGEVFTVQYLKLLK